MPIVSLKVLLDRIEKVENKFGTAGREPFGWNIGFKQTMVFYFFHKTWNRFIDSRDYTFWATVLHLFSRQMDDEDIFVVR